jgi:predicted pyridoxine 5'-phosphate oxidase superfamily flavin-nucleotide-binding protein
LSTLLPINHTLQAKAMDDILNPGFIEAPHVKAMINIGGTFDIPTGHFVEGELGAAILNAGLAGVTGFVGLGNQYKSTMMMYQLYMAWVRISCLYRRSTGSLYDTEINIHVSRQRVLMARAIAEVMAWGGWDEDLVDQRKLTVTDKSIYLADDWYDIFKTWLTNKRKGAKDILVNTPFFDLNGNLIQIPTPTFGGVDSFSEFVGSNTQKMADANKLGNSKANTMYMKQGQDKSRFLMEIPALCAGAAHYIGLTAHMGQKIEMDEYNPSPKQLQHLTNNLQIKGATGKFTYLTNNVWWCNGAKALQEEANNDGPLYPSDPEDRMKYDPDLNQVTVRNLRGKSGVTGLGQTILVSQREGLLPTLTEFHYIKGVKESDTKRWGIQGNNINYALDLLPDVKLSRTVVRTKIDNDPILRRAMNITSELCQISQLWDGTNDMPLQPAELYAKVKEQGYNWDVLLNTRGWWTADNASPEHARPFLSTMDLVRMAKGEYTPFWMDKDKQIKAEYRK